MRLILELLDDNPERAELLKLLAQEDIDVLSQAYVYAKNLMLYGVDVSEKWDTMTKQAANLEKSYTQGYYEGMSLNKEDKFPECARCKYRIRSNWDDPCVICMKKYIWEKPTHFRKGDK